MRHAAFILLLAAVALLFPPYASSVGEGPWECLWGTDCSSASSSSLQLGSSTAGDGLYEDVPLHFMSTSTWFSYVNEFTMGDEVSGTELWIKTSIGAAGSFVLTDDQPLSIATLNPADVNDNGVQVQISHNVGMGVVVKPAAGRIIVMEMRISLDEWDTLDYFFGLVDEETGIQDGTGAWQVAVTDAVVFYAQVGDAGIIEAGYEAANNNYTDVGDVNLAAFSDDAYHTFGIRIEGTSYAEWYVDGSMVQSATLGDAITGQLTPSFGVISDGAGDSMRIDFLAVHIER